MFDLSKENSISTIVVDLSELGRTYENLFGDFLLPAAPGIYAIGRAEPLVDFTTPLYCEYEGRRLDVTPSNWMECPVDIRSSSTDHVVVPHQWLTSKVSILKPTPTMPYRGIRLAEAVLTKHLDDFVEWRTRRSDFSKIYRHFNADFKEDSAFEETVERIMHESTHSLSTWLGDHSWNLYLCKRTGTRLAISRYQDYRILDWMARRKNGTIEL